MVFLYVMAGVSALFAAILSINLSVRVSFDSSAEESVRVFAKIGFYKIRIIPARQKKEKPKKPVKQKKLKEGEKEKKRKRTGGEPPKEKKKHEIGEIFDLIKAIGTALLKRFKKHFKAKIYKIDLILAAGEAEKTAMLYGEAIASAYCLNEFLERNFRVRKKTDSVKIIPDFSKTRSSYRIDVKFCVRAAHIAALGIASIMKFLKFWLNPQKTNR
ncbi:MAG: hypothetical protein FWG34_03155 [Oscillospiraceae bacterium]|nr:hypothetical protein [Oscillospiraceae bacterium]